MATNRERPPRLSAAIIFHGCVTLAVASVGVAGVLHDASRPAAATWNIHALFGALLLLSVGAKYAWQVRHAGLENTLAVTAFARGLSRQLYILLYALAGIKELLYFLPSGSAHALNAPAAAFADSMKEFQSYAAYGFLALAAIWMLAALFGAHHAVPKLPQYHRSA